MHSTGTQESFRLGASTNDILPEVPKELQRYLTSTERPQEIYRLIDRDNDRQIRLLLRRFTNQIQYGCTNPHCNVPTCLSYRKRTAPGPLRRHTDLTARALAVKCLEQYASHGRDLARYSHRGKGKGKQISYDSDGLCWSDPIVPWYTDPNDFFTRQKTADRKKSIEKYVSTGPVPAGTAQTRLSQSSPSELPARPANNLEDDREDGTNTTGREGHGEELHDGPSPKSQPENREDCKDASHPDVLQPEVNRKQEVRTPERHDQASFTQSLFKHHKLSQLDKSSADTPLSQETRVNASSDSSDLKGWAGADRAATHTSTSTLGLFHTGQPVATFSLLPPKVIKWFRSMFAKNNDVDQRARESLRENLRSLFEQSLYFVFGDPTRLLLSGSSWDDTDQQKTDEALNTNHDSSSSKLPKFENVVEAGYLVATCFPDSDQRFRIAPHLMRALQHCYRLPHYIKQPNSAILATGRYQKFLPNSEAARLILIVLNMIASTKPLFNATREPHYLSQVHSGKWTDTEIRSAFPGIQVPCSLSSLDKHNGDHGLYAMMAFCQYQADVLPLCECVADIISHRIAVDRATDAIQSRPFGTEHGSGFISQVMCLIQIPSDDDRSLSQGSCRARQMLDFMQTVFYKKWDRRPILKRAGPVGGALEMLKSLFTSKAELGLNEDWFTMHSIPAALDEVEMPFEWLSFHPDSTKMHILQFSFLFPPKAVVRYFRSLNLKIMKQSHEKAMAMCANGNAQLIRGRWRCVNVEDVLNITRPHMARYFVMTIRRSHLLEDAIGQIWQRERQELLRPLKVTLGKDEGENGLDHGGVQQEFFRLAFAEALDPRYSMFDVDPITHMAWFKPGAMEPLYKYEALGILMSLAVYNGVTVPINMPLAFYRKILGLKVKKIEHIEDGWPELACSFRQLLAWEEGDVEDVMALNYEFSYDAFGKTVTIDITDEAPFMRCSRKSGAKSKGKQKASAFKRTGLSNGEAATILDDDDMFNIDGGSRRTQSSLPTPVTNANREDYVRSYIAHLTHHTIKQQFESFLHGLHTLLSPTALSLFTPSHLKLLFEGHPTSNLLSVSSWRSITKYEDFTAEDPIITWFWEVLEQDLSQNLLRKLLEFVTASDRLPVGGWEGITFIVQRNGAGDDRLPGSSTCYGRLLLPEYSSKEILRGRLVKAIQEGLGFGMI